MLGFNETLYDEEMTCAFNYVHSGHMWIKLLKLMQKHFQTKAV